MGASKGACHGRSHLGILQPPNLDYDFSHLCPGWDFSLPSTCNDYTFSAGCAILKVMTKPALLKLCALWQERLLLQDWTVSIEMDRELESWGLNEWEETYRTAKIKIHPDGPEGVEFYVVHELLHLRLFKIRVTAETELTINFLVRSFLRAYRRKRK